MRADPQRRRLGREALLRSRSRVFALGLTLATLAPCAARAQALPDTYLERIRRVANFGHDYDLPGGGLIALNQAVRDVINDRLVAIVASHPDDQYVLAAAYLRFRLNYRVAVVLFTRGEGGQNAWGSEVGDELGRLRTLETEDCARQLGVEVWYLNRQDGGYCRTGEEALELWGRDSTVDELAGLLRRIRPDIVLTPHHSAETHGHDQGLLDVLPRAVERAADPLLSTPGAKPVDITRLFIGARETFDFELPDRVDEDRGYTYRELAYRALTSAHLSQAPFRKIHDLFEPETRLISVPLGSREAVRTMSEGLPDLFTDLGPEVDRTELRQKFELLRLYLGERSKLIESALELRERMLKLHAEPGSDLALRIRRRTEALERIVQHGLGIRVAVELAPGQGFAVPGEDLKFSIDVHAGGLYPVQEVELSSRNGDTVRITDQRHTGDERSWHCEATYEVPEDADARGSMADLFRRDRFSLPLALDLKFRVGVAGTATTSLTLPLELPTDIRPAVELEVMPDPILLPEGGETLAFAVRVRRNTSRSVHGALTVTVPAGLVATPASYTVDMQGEVARDYRFSLRVPSGLLQRTTRPIWVSLGGQWNARVPLHRVSVSISPDLRVGLVQGVDDTARTILGELGVELIMLGEEDLPTRDLSDLDTILVDIRALRSHRAARAGFNRLTEFAEAGGRLVVFYHKDTEFNTGLRGYPEGLDLHIGKGRVTREDAPVRTLLPDHILLNHPNKIRSEDWDGWKQERGLYFPDAYSDRYEELISLADPGEPEEHGSLLYARAGKGEYVYCALSLYRQLKSLHGGACRLFANLVSRPSGSGR